MGSGWNVQILNEIKQFVLKLVQLSITCFIRPLAGVRINCWTCCLVFSVDSGCWRCRENPLHNTALGVGREKTRQDRCGVADMRLEPLVELNSVVQRWNAMSTAVSTLLVATTMIPTAYCGHLNPQNHSCTLHNMQQNDFNIYNWSYNDIGIGVFGIAQYTSILCSIGYWTIFLLAVIPNTNTAQTLWC